MDMTTQERSSFHHEDEGREEHGEVIRSLSELYDRMQEQPLEPADVVVWLEGDEDDRVQQCVRLMERKFSPRLLLSGGRVQRLTDGNIPSWDIKEKFLEQGIQQERILLETESQHTKDQALHVLRLAKDNGWKRIILVSSPYHQVRVFLTFLAELQRQHAEQEVYLMNAPARLNWFRPVQKRGRDAVDLLEQEELPRIVRYQKAGDVASFEAGMTYLHTWASREKK